MQKDLADVYFVIKEIQENGMPVIYSIGIILIAELAYLIYIAKDLIEAVKVLQFTR